MNRMLFRTAFAVFFFVGCNEMQAKDPPLLEKLVYKDAAGKELPYRLLKPQNADPAKKYPLVVLLHGAGERGTDNEKQLTHGVAAFTSKDALEKYPCFMIVPQCPNSTKWVDVDWSANSHVMPKEMTDPSRLTIELIRKLLKDEPIDPKRVYLTGLSMGGYGTWDLAARFPDLFAAIAPVCGGGDEATAATIKDLPIWAFHGAKDTVVKTIRSKNMIAAIEKAGGKPKYTEYPTIGHNAWTPAYADPELMKWLFEQKK